MNPPDRSRIRKWMIAHISEFVDDCNEIDLTGMVEAWDSACSTGDATLNSYHPAWEIAMDVAEKHKPADRSQPIRQFVRRQLID